MDTDNCIIRIKTEDFYEDITNVVEKLFDEDDKMPLPLGKSKKELVFLRMNQEERL